MAHIPEGMLKAVNEAPFWDGLDRKEIGFIPLSVQRQMLEAAFEWQSGHPIYEIAINENDREEHKLFKRILIEQRKNNQILQEIKQIMSTVPAGLAALQAADQQIADAITAVAQAIKDASDKLSQSVNAEDATVGTVAATVSSQAQALNDLAKNLESAVNPPAPTPTPTPTPAQ